MTEQEIQKAIAKKKRIIMEVAGQIHDIVEDSLWSAHDQLPALSEKIQLLMAELAQFKQQHVITGASD